MEDFIESIYSVLKRGEGRLDESYYMYVKRADDVVTIEIAHTPTIKIVVDKDADLEDVAREVATIIVEKMSEKVAEWVLDDSLHDEYETPLYRVLDDDPSYFYLNRDGQFVCGVDGGNEVEYDLEGIDDKKSEIAELVENWMWL